MQYQGYILFFFGLSLVIALVAIIVFYYARRRHDNVEAPKYSMMDDDD